MVAIAALSVLTSDNSVTKGIAVLGNVSRSVPALEAPSGRVVRVSTEAELQAAVGRLASRQTILIAPGIYRLSKTLVVGGRELVNVAIRGASARREDVILLGPGMDNRDADAPPFGIWTGNGVRGLLLANLTIRGFSNHSIIFNEGTDSPHLYNVALLDAGEQLLKSNPNLDGTGVRAGVVEYSLFAYSSGSRDDYTNAIDVHGGANWVIRRNTFVNIRAPLGELAGPTILMWRGSSGTTVDSNTFVNCQREISFGLEPVAIGRRRQMSVDHSDGVIRNNMIVRDAAVQGDVAILVAASPNTQVLHNTILIDGAYPNAIEYRFATTTNLLIANNLTNRDIVGREGAQAALRHNSTSAERQMFVDPTHGDLHLLATARLAVSSGEWVDNAAVDWDGDLRPPGSAPDLGADQLRSSPFELNGHSGSDGHGVH
jgi:hypothetical protein